MLDVCQLGGMNSEKKEPRSTMTVLGTSTWKQDWESCWIGMFGQGGSKTIPDSGFDVRSVLSQSCQDTIVDYGRTWD